MFIFISQFLSLFFAHMPQKASSQLSIEISDKPEEMQKFFYPSIKISSFKDLSGLLISRSSF